jgi:hypothetical protein
MSPSIVPTARALFLCDYCIGSQAHKVDLYGVFNAINAKTFPHVQRQFCVFAQLVGGLGKVPFYVAIRNAAASMTIFRSALHTPYFPNRTLLVYLTYAVNDCLFPLAGDYVVELYCNKQWVADTVVLLH